MSAEKLAEHAVSLAVGACALLLPANPITGLNTAVGGFLGLIRLGRNLTGPAVGRVCTQGRARALEAVQAIPEFRTADFDRAAALLETATFAPFTQAQFIAAVEQTGAAGPGGPLAAHLLSLIRFDGDSEATKRAVAVALQTATDACLTDPDLRAEMAQLQIMEIIRRLHLQDQFLTAIDAKLDRLLQENDKTARELGLAQGLVIGLARRIAEGVEDFDTALRELERAIGIAARMERAASLPSNLGDQIGHVLAEVSRLNAAQSLDAAAGVIRDAYEQIEAARARLIDAGLEQDILRRDAASAARWVVIKVEMEAQGPDPFAALRDERVRWYVSGRDKGLAFDLEVSIALARASYARARDADQRGMALNDLGVSLQTLGEREPGPARLIEAVAAYRAALEEVTRDRVPLDWARAQMNLGNALATLGTREPGTARLTEAVAAYRAALKEMPRDRVPLDWAGAQMNLGNALATLGELGTGTGRLTEAVEAYRAALEEWTRDRVPLDWAGAQMNLGNALAALGTREAGTGRLTEAVEACRAALEERTRDRVPLDWAGAQMNLGNALWALGTREPGTGRLTEAVEAYRAALEEWTRDRVPLDWAMTQMNLGVALAALGRREPGTGRLTEAVAAYRAALEEWTRDRVPLDWATVQMNLGLALATLGERETGTARLTEAVEAYRAALEERTRDRVPLDWALATGNLGAAQVTLADRTDDLPLARSALANLTVAEAVLREGGHVSWAETFARQIPAAQALIARLSER